MKTRKKKTVCECCRMETSLKCGECNKYVCWSEFCTIPHNRGTCVELSKRVRDVLDALSMRYVRELTVFSEAELRMLPRVGSVTIAEIRRYLRSRKLRLRAYEWRGMPEAIRVACVKAREAIAARR